MAVGSITTVTCDRCGEHVEFSNLAIIHSYDEWGKIMATRTNRDDEIGRYTDGPKGAADLCPSCIDDLFCWWRKGKSKKNAP